MTFVTITEAIDWTTARWDGQRPAPIRLHQAHSVDGPPGGLMFPHAFGAALDARDGDETVMRVIHAPHTTPCYHPLSFTRPNDCPECFGVGLKDTTVARFQYPMTLALSKLARAPRLIPSRVHPLALVLTLADHGWDWRATSRSLDVQPDTAERLLLRAIRQLHSRYAEGPVRWIDKSESQQHAEALAS